MKKTVLPAILLLIQTINVFSQNSGKVIRFCSSHTSFPDAARANGHTYDSVFYPAKDHYDDSSVLLLVPANLPRNQKVDLVFWFHGWHNNIDTANQFYEIEKQFLASGRNAVLVLAETAKNAPDSYGGKLEKQGEFRNLVNDILQQLKKEKLAVQSAVAGNVTLAGHSGAYRVIAYILANGEVPVDEVFLFDALYSETDKFLSWIQQDQRHRFVNWYTDHGGTDGVSIEMMKQLDQLHFPYRFIEETSIGSNNIKTSKVLFVHSLRQHNVIISRPDNWKLLLQNQ